MARTTPVADQATVPPPTNAPTDAPASGTPASGPPASGTPGSGTPGRPSAWTRLRQWLLDRRESFANIVIIVLLAGGGPFVYFRGPPVAAHCGAHHAPA